jgi:hypothetical protein
MNAICCFFFVYAHKYTSIFSFSRLMLQWLRSKWILSVSHRWSELTSSLDRVHINEWGADEKVCDRWMNVHHFHSSVKKKKWGTVVEVNYMHSEYSDNECSYTHRIIRKKVTWTSMYIYILSSRVNETCYFDKFQLPIISNNSINDMIRMKLIWSNLDQLMYLPLQMARDRRLLFLLLLSIRSS